MKSAYIAGPYTGETKLAVRQNVERAALYAAKYFKQGYAVFCPHLQSNYIDEYLNDNKVLEYEDYMTNDFYWLGKCDVVVFIPGWEHSNGARMENMLAEALGKEIHYVD